MAAQTVFTSILSLNTNTHQTTNTHFDSLILSTPPSPSNLQQTAAHALGNPQGYGAPCLANHLTPALQKEDKGTAHFLRPDPLLPILCHLPSAPHFHKAKT